ncbi:MAG: DoxX family protein [Maribacter sp.]|uniref:DoxX family protein n=1 Tax=Maribacter sp. 2307UL18-2 TaxID=3386274 RepID=UPI0039BC22C2
MKVQKIAYYLATGVLTAIMVYSVQMYLRNPDAIADYFESVDYPRYLVYPLAIAKILGLVAIWGNFSKWLKEWAYAGFFFDVMLAFTAHKVAQDGGELFSIIAFIALIVSYFLGKTVRP